MMLKNRERRKYNLKKKVMFRKKKRERKKEHNYLLTKSKRYVQSRYVLKQKINCVIRDYSLIVYLMALRTIQRDQ